MLTFRPLYPGNNLPSLYTWVDFGDQISVQVGWPWTRWLPSGLSQLFLYGATIWVHVSQFSHPLIVNGYWVLFVMGYAHRDVQMLGPPLLTTLEAEWRCNWIPLSAAQIFLASHHSFCFILPQISEVVGTEDSPHLSKFWRLSIYFWSGHRAYFLGGQLSWWCISNCLFTSRRIHLMWLTPMDVTAGCILSCKVSHLKWFINGLDLP